MNELDIKELGLESLSAQELVDIDGGDKNSYEIGQSLGKAIKNVAMVAGIIAIFSLS